MDKKQIHDGKYLWQCLPNGTARILRVYAPNGVIIIPGELEGHPVAEIGAYCFSDSERLSDVSLQETVIQEGDRGSAHFQLIAGSDLESLLLPDSVVEIKDFAFYNCRKLQRLQIGRETRKIGSDVFMNCASLQTVEIRCGVEEASGVAMILQQISTEIVIYFMGSLQGSEAKLLYPEYSESYDEIAPAHIFGRNITGEGFRARQLLENGVVQLERYDGILDKVAVEEIGLTIGRLALFRLLYPVALRQEKQVEYERQLRLHALETAQYYIDLRDLGILQKMCEHSYLQGADLEKAIQYSILRDWSEGSASLLDWKQRYGMIDRRKRYSFD
ncbi:MAG: leucine-rich repeat domain-containing protein [Lachnospiraceae bacterium]|nr:leucine-rich repeat domain-containing protein [Lachnospiraceae bacterium]